MEWTRRADALSLVIVVALGFALWRLIDAISQSLVGALIQTWEERDSFGPFGQTFEVGGVDFEYGQVLTGILAMLLLGLLWLLLHPRTVRTEP